MRTTILATVAALTTSSACSTHYVDPDAGTDEAQARSYSSSEEDLLVLAANTLSFDELDHDVGLDKRAAQGLVDLRPFDSIDAVDAVPYVGPAALDALLDYAQDEGLGGAVHGYTEGSPEAIAILAAANASTVPGLVQAGLDDRLADHIADQRPFVLLQDLAALCGADPVAFDLLYELGTVDAGCPAGKVVSSVGWTYDTLDRALHEAKEDTVLTLCHGSYLIEDDVVTGVQLVGQGAGLTEVTYGGTTVFVGTVALSGLLLPEGGHFDAATVTLDQVTFGDFVEVDSSWVVGSDVAFDDAELRMEHGAQVELERASFRHANQAIRVGYTGSGHLVLTDSEVLDNQSGIYVHAGSATFDNVDFGFGDADNGHYDVLTRYGASYTALHGGESGSCDEDGCTF